MRKRLPALIVLILFLLGLSVFLYGIWSEITVRGAEGPATKAACPCLDLKPESKVPNSKGNSTMEQAYFLSGGDKNFVRLLDCENSSWDPRRQSGIMVNGKREDSWGLCQISRRWHQGIVDDPRFFTDVSWQIGQCLILYRGGTKFSCAPGGKVRDTGHIIFREEK